MNDFELNAINERHITELQAEAANIALAASLDTEPTNTAKATGFVRRAGAAFGRAVHAARVTGAPSGQQPV